jgi:hypothetical protein
MLIATDSSAAMTALPISQRRPDAMRRCISPENRPVLILLRARLPSLITARPRPPTHLARAPARTPAPGADAGETSQEPIRQRLVTVAPVEFSPRIVASVAAFAAANVCLMILFVRRGALAPAARWRAGPQLGSAGAPSEVGRLSGDAMYGSDQGQAGRGMRAADRGGGTGTKSRQQLLTPRAGLGIVGQ